MKSLLSGKSVWVQCVDRRPYQLLLPPDFEEFAPYQEKLSDRALLEKIQLVSPATQSNRNWYVKVNFETGEVDADSAVVSARLPGKALAEYADSLSHCPVVITKDDPVLSSYRFTEKKGSAFIVDYFTRIQRIVSRTDSEILTAVFPADWVSGYQTIPDISQERKKQLVSSVTYLAGENLHYYPSLLEFEPVDDMKARLEPILEEIGLKLVYLRRRLCSYHHQYDNYKHPCYFRSNLEGFKVVQKGNKYGLDLTKGYENTPRVYDYMGECWVAGVATESEDKIQVPIFFVNFITPEQFEDSKQYCSDETLLKSEPWADLMYLSCSHCERNPNQKRGGPIDFHSCHINRKSLQTWLATSFSHYCLTRGFSMPKNVVLVSGTDVAERKKLIEKLQAGG